MWATFEGSLSQSPSLVLYCSLPFFIKCFLSLPSCFLSGHTDLYLAVERKTHLMKALEKDSIPHIRAMLLLGPHYFFVVLAQQIRSVLLVLPSVIFFSVLCSRTGLLQVGRMYSYPSSGPSLSILIVFLMFKTTC